MKTLNLLALGLTSITLLFSSCKKDDEPMPQSKTIVVENVLDSKLLVQSGTFTGPGKPGTPPVVFPGQSVSFSFYAGVGQKLSFATMYGWSNDLFFAPENPGIALYDDKGNPITGDVSAKIKLWDNGTRVNQAPGQNITHPGTAETTTKAVKEVNGTDDYQHTYLPASQLMHAMLSYDIAKQQFTITISNNSGGTANETPFSPFAWAISYAPGGNVLMPESIYAAGKMTANGLTKLAETGSPDDLGAYLAGNTGIFTPLSPILVVVYNGNSNPFYALNEKDRGEGLKELSQKGNADILAAALKTKSGVKMVYVLPDPANKVLLPKVNGNMGGKVSQQLSVVEGDKIALATMYGVSNDWFFATKSGDIPATQMGDVTSYVGLFDNGTAVDGFPGAHGASVPESKNIMEVPAQTNFITVPSVDKFIKVTLQ